MSKEKEALSTIAFNTQMGGMNFGDELRTLEKSLKRLEAIDNTNPSEALEILEEISKEEVLFKSRNTIYMGGEKSETFNHKNTIGNEFKGALDTIENALLKAQELEKENQELLQAVALFKQKLEDTDNIKVAQTMMKQLDKIVSLEKENKALKVQEPKQYLKWEDLEFDHKPKYIDVKMGDNKYLLIVGFSDGGNEMAILQTKIRRYYFVESEDNKQFFNDLHLERVEE